MQSINSSRLLAVMLACGAGPANAQDGGAASIETGLSYSSQRGALAFVGVSADDLMGSGIDISLGYQASEDGEGLDGRIGWTREFGETAMGADTFVSTRISGRISDWPADAYTLESYGIEVVAGAAIADNLSYQGRVFAQQDTLSDFDDNISPLAAVPLEKSQLIGFGAGVSYVDLSGTGVMATGLAANASFNVATSAGDREWSSIEGGFQYNAPLPMNTVLAVGAEAGQIAGRNGQTVHIVDRAFLGNPSPRGFAFAGLGPRDYVEGDVDTALGGNRYVTSSIELRVPTANPALTFAAFVDAGAVWELDEVEGGASGTIDDSYALRTSIGLSVYWETAIGPVQLNLAKALDSEPFDRLETVSLGLGFRF